MASADCIQIYRLGQTLHAFSNPIQAPTYFGGRWIAPGQSANLSDWMCAAIHYVLDTAYNRIVVGVFGYEPLADRSVRAKAALSVELQNLATKATKIWKQYKPLETESKTYPIAGFNSPQECASFMLYWQTSVAFSDEQWDAIAAHMGDDLPVICQDSSFKEICQAPDADTSLIVWDTFNIAPPVAVIRLLLLGKAKALSQENRLSLESWVAAYNRNVDAPINRSPDASKLLELIEWVYLNKTKSPQMQEAPQKSLKTLEILRSSFGLNAFSTSTALLAKAKRTQVDNVVRVDQTGEEAKGLYTLTKEVSSDLTKRMPGVLRIWEATPYVNDSDGSVGAAKESGDLQEKVWIYLFSNEVLGPLCKSRLQNLNERGCAAFPEEYIPITGSVSSTSLDFQEDFGSSAFVVKAPAVVANPKEIPEASWKAFFSWMKEKKEHALFDPHCVGTDESDKLCLLDLWTPFQLQYEDQEESKKRFDPKYLSQYLVTEGQTPSEFTRKLLRWFDEAVQAEQTV